MPQGDRSQSSAWQSFLPFALSFSFFGVSTFALVSQPSSGLTYICASIVLLPFAVCVHELGHAVGCIAAGGKVQYIQIGSPTPEYLMMRFRFLGFSWRISSLPFSGFVMGTIALRDHYRLRRCMFIAAGPLANIVLLVAGILAVFECPTGTSSLYLTAWTWTNFLLLLGSLIPIRHYRMGKVRGNDAQLLLDTLAYTDAEIESHVESAKICQRHEDGMISLEGLTLGEISALQQKYPTDPGYAWTVLQRYQELGDSGEFGFLLKVSENPALSDEDLAAMLDSALTRQLELGPPKDPVICEKLSERLLRFSDTVSTRGTRGSVLVDLGRIEEGKAMLLDVMTQSVSLFDKTYANIFLALAEIQGGELDRARSYARSAAQLSPDCPALKRVADLLELAERRS